MYLFKMSLQVKKKVSTERGRIMEITLVQGLLLSLVALICGLDFWLEALFIFRPMIVCTLTGLVLGDLRLGLTAAAITELAFAGLTPAGGTQPPNPILAGVMTVVIAYTTKTNPTIAIGLSLPFSFLMQYIILFFYSTFSFFMPKADHYAQEADTAAFVRLNILTSAIVTISYAVVVFLSAYLAQDLMRNLVNSMPGWLTHGFEVAGGILPAIGFAMLLKVMLKAPYAPYLIIGFVAASFIPFGNILPVAVIGVALALLEYFKDKDEKEKIMRAIRENDQSGGGRGGI